MPGAYYNEIEPYAAQWLRNLISAGLIAAGDVDERSIVEVQPDDVRGYTQAHFFAGIGVWSHAARLGGVADSDRIWTGSCPCQPFSAAGKQRGTDDERHLWPEFHRLIRECRPPIVLGEQVASALGRQWLGAVRADLEALGYAVAAADLGAASVGAPHIRQRLWWAGVGLGNASREGLPAREREALERAGRREEGRAAQQPSCASGGLADDDEAGRGGQPPARIHGRWPGARGDQPAARDTDGASGHDADRRGAVGGLADAQAGGRREQRDAVEPGQGRHADSGGDAFGSRGAGEADSFWRDADWLLCRDNKWRPVEPGTFPLAHGAPARVGRLRAYGNAIVAPLAAEFISAVMECRP